MSCCIAKPQTVDGEQVVLVGGSAGAESYGMRNVSYYIGEKDCAAEGRYSRTESVCSSLSACSRAYG